MPGWPKWVNSSTFFHGSPALGDLTGDGRLGGRGSGPERVPLHIPIQRRGPRRLAQTILHDGRDRILPDHRRRDGRRGPRHHNGSREREAFRLERRRIVRPGFPDPAQRLRAGHSHGRRSRQGRRHGTGRLLLEPVRVRLGSRSRDLLRIRAMERIPRQRAQQRLDRSRRSYRSRGDRLRLPVVRGLPDVELVGDNGRRRVGSLQEGRGPGSTSFSPPSSRPTRRASSPIRMS